MFALAELGKLSDPNTDLFSNLEAVAVAAFSIHFAVMLVVLVLEKLKLRVPAFLASSIKLARLRAAQAQQVEKP